MLQRRNLVAVPGQESEEPPHTRVRRKVAKVEAKAPLSLQIMILRQSILMMLLLPTSIMIY